MQVDKQNLNNSMFALVREFHARFGHPASSYPVVLPPDRVIKRTAWMNEELGEFHDASNIVDQVDALVDLLYFTFGTFVEMGIDPATPFRIVHEANLGKLDENGKPILDLTGKIRKPEHWLPPEPALREYLCHELLKATLIGLTDNAVAARDFPAAEGSCLTGCLAMAANRMKVDVGVTIAEVEHSLSTVAEESNTHQSDDRRLGTEVDVQAIKRFFAKLGMNVTVEYKKADIFEDWNFIDELIADLELGKQIICTLSSGKLLNHRRVQLGHAILLLAANSQKVTYFDVTKGNFGIHEIEGEDLYAASKSRQGGMLTLVLER